jgi:hypothetical protein
VFHSWFSSESDGVLLKIRNQNEGSYLWSVVARTSLNLTIISLPRCQTFLDTSVPHSSLVHSLQLKMTGASLARTKCTSCCLGYHTSLPFWFHKWLRTLPSSFLPRSGRQSWPNTEVGFRLYVLADKRHDPDLGIKKVITATFMPLKWRSGTYNHFLFSDEPLFHRKSRDEISWGGEGCNTPGVTVVAIVPLHSFYGISTVET